MSDYNEQLQAAKSAALAALTDLLLTTTDPVEKRRIATTILRIPTPKPTPDGATQTRATQNRATGSPPALRRQPVPDTSDTSDTRDAEARTPTAPNPLAPSPNSQLPHPNPLDFIRESNALLNMLSARPKRLRRRATHAASLAPSG